MFEIRNFHTREDGCWWALRHLANLLAVVHYVPHALLGQMDDTLIPLLPSHHYLSMVDTEKWSHA